MKIKKIITFVLAALLLFGFSGCYNLGGGPPSLVNTLVFDLGTVNYISVEYIAENVTVTTSEADTQLVVKEYINRDDSRLFARTQSTGGELRIQHGQRDGISGLRSYIEISLPKSYAGGFDVSVVSGNIEFSGNDNEFKGFDFSTLSGSISVSNFSSSEIDLSTMSGRITLSDIESSEVSASSMSGSVDAQKLDAKEIYLSSASGRVTADSCTGRFDLESTSGSVKAVNCAGGGDFNSTSGSVEVDLSSFDYDVSAESTSGSIEITLPKGSSFVFSGESISGKIEASFDNELNISSQGQFAGQVGSNPKLEVSAETVTGRISAGWR